MGNRGPRQLIGWFMTPVIHYKHRIGGLLSYIMFVVNLSVLVTMKLLVIHYSYSYVMYYCTMVY